MAQFFYQDQIVEQLLTTNEVFSSKDREELKRITENDDMDRFHDKFGKQIRNMYSLYNVQNPNTFNYDGKMIKLPVDASFDIIVSVWEELNKK